MQLQSPQSIHENIRNIPLALQALEIPSVLDFLCFLSFLHHPDKIMIKIQLYEQALLALNSNPIRIMFSTHTDFQAMCPKSSSAVQDLSMFLSRLDDFRIVQSLPLIEYDLIFFLNLSSVSLLRT